jgi:hypothetical protein
MHATRENEELLQKFEVPSLISFPISLGKLDGYDALAMGCQRAYLFLGWSIQLVR